MDLAGKGVIIIFLVLLLPIATAEWTSNLNEEIRSYYTFNETGNPLVDLVSGLNASGRGTNFQFAQEGIINGSVYGDTGSLNSVVYLNQSADGSSEFNIFSDGIYSVSIWSNTQNIENSNSIISFRGEAATYVNKEVPGNSSNHTYIWELNDNSSTGLFVNIPIGNWFHYTITSNLTDRSVYLNGDLKNRTHGTIPIRVINGSPINSSYLSFENDGGFWDEFGIWNRSLTFAEVAQLYNNGSGITYNPLMNESVINPPNATFYNLTVENDLVVGGNALIEFLGIITNKVKTLFVENANIENLNVTGSVIIPHEISQPERDFNVVYFNNNSRPLMIYGSAFIVHETGADRARVILKTDNSTKPVTIVQNSGMDDMPSGVGKREMYFPFSMVVKPFEYYKIENSTTGSSSVSLDKWNEVEL